jgi:16S rRNA processing protein RimM
VHLVDVGYVRRAHGIDGEVAVRPTTDDPGRWVPGATFLTDEEPPRTLEVIAVRPHHGDLLVAFAGIADRNAAMALRGVTFHIEGAQRRSLGEGEYWPDDLIGCAAVDAGGVRYGTVVDVAFGVGQDRLVVETADGRRVEVPLVVAIVEGIDLDGALVRMTPPEGLF